MESVVPEKIDLDGLNKVFDGRFEGVPVRIDKFLKGGQYYIAVSKELYERLKMANKIYFDPTSDVEI